MIELYLLPKLINYDKKIYPPPTFLNTRNNKSNTIFKSSLLFIFLAITFWSCKKNIDVDASFSTENKVANFLKIPPNSSTAIKRVIAKLKEMETKHPFLENYIQQRGLANWEKSLVTTPNPTTTNSYQNLDNNEDITYVTTPIFLSGSNVVRSLISAKVTPTEVFIKFLEDYQYKTLPSKANAEPNELAKEDYAYYYFYFSNQIYGQTDFIINDSTLFKDQINAVLQPGQSLLTGELINTSFRGLTTAPSTCFSVINSIPVVQITPYGITFVSATPTTVCIPTGLTDIFPNITQIGNPTPAPIPAGYVPGWILNSRFNKSPFALDENDENTNAAGPYDNNAYNAYSGSNFPTVNNIINTYDFIGWSTEGIPSFSIDYVKAQLAIANYKISDFADNTGNAPYGQTYQIYNETTGVNTTATNDAIGYISGALQAGIPVVVGVDCCSGSSFPSYDNTTDHFVVIVGMGNDPSFGNYFKFYDCSAFNRILVTSNLNKLFIRSNGQVGDTSATLYSTSSGFHDYIITQVRRSKLL